MKRLSFLVACAAILSSGVRAEPTPTPSPYSGQEMREIKALSAEDVQAYLNGKGMGLAKTAELNGYPGPAHVLELSSELSLTPEQRKRTESLFATMQAQAVEAGRPLVDEERRLDRLFAGKSITPKLLSTSLGRIGELQGRVRAAHLAAHLAQVRILTPDQVARYAQLRGYDSNEALGTMHHPRTRNNARLR